ncbi:hypothetical protein CJD36_004475 [Flavipsychrobacter stenotrophus]|uniref:Uncharacterized protein n=1 Tax=Flavipsychrobacter stenotrophus TaxID=2077091 RepID=A0A2S7T2I4_9BACT|nr:hypothetical protein [Flavipsychrobacter stenotrophus]PQJ13005.1 hypothetical protein CJD36_004475 [Flavipsychrobacter stenotrophus]
MTYLKLYLIALIAIVLHPAAGIGQQQHSLKIHTDYPSLSKARTLHQLVYISSDFSFKGMLQLRSVKYNSGNDSIVVLTIKNQKVQVHSGLSKFKVKYEDDDTNATFSVPYLEILKRTGGIAPGLYRTTVTITDAVTHKEYTAVFLQEADSILGAGSGLRSDVNKKLTPASGPFASLKKRAEKVKAYGSGNAIRNAKKKLKDVSANRGLTHVQYEKRGKAYIDFYYENWFAGRYEVSDKKPLSNQLLGQQDIAAATNMNKLAGNELNSPSLFSQFKAFKKQKDDNKEIEGETAMTTNVASNPDPGSGIDNNYFEVRGMVEIPISGLPFELEGMYTSQDARRSVKSSYFRVHYDVSKVKDELQQFIGAYNQKYAETKSKGVGMQQVYQKMISSMEGQKTKLTNELKKESSLEDGKSLTTIGAGDIVDTAALKQQAISTVDSNNKAGKLADDASEKKAKALKKKEQLEKKYKELEALDKKIEKYKALLEQNKNNNYFDSAVAYSKIRTQDYNSPASYKQLVKKSSDILPDGAAKKFVSGLTNVDAGMFSKYSSKYTMSGQMMKGLDLGYDLGFCEVGGTVGKTEYVGRDGTPDKYTCYSGRAIFNFLETQKIGFIYYGYTIDKTAFAGDGFFKNVNIATPTFSNPVHILSVNYGGTASKYVTIEAEGAMSIKKYMPVEGRSSTTYGKDNMAWHISSDGNIPNTSVSLLGSYDKTGKQFENSTLPLSRTGTEQYKLAGKTDLFHSFVSVGIEYNYLLQSSFSGTASNTKWGFDIKTHSKRYPTVSISYKPFATFRSYSDTLNIPQRPLLGAVWTSKASYQLKENGRIWRFNLLYNKCITVLDTTAYGNTLMQLMCMYTKKQVSVAAIAGYTSQTGGNTTTAIVTAPDRMSFLSFTESYTISKQYSITGSQDIGHAKFGMCKYGLSVGVMCSFKKSPITARMNLRYSDYKLNEVEQWKQLYSGNMEVAYRFKAKKKGNNFK